MTKKPPAVPLPKTPSLTVAEASKPLQYTRPVKDATAKPLGYTPPRKPGRKG